MPLPKPLIFVIVGAAVTISKAVTLNIAFAPQTPASVLILRGVGQVIAGGVLSHTFTVKLQEEDKFNSSVAVAVTVVVPIGKTLPLAGVLSAEMDAPL